MVQLKSGLAGIGSGKRFLAVEEEGTLSQETERPSEPDDLPPNVAPDQPLEEQEGEEDPSQDDGQDRTTSQRARSWTSS
jgi:hypothetical protein